MPRSESSERKGNANGTAEPIDLSDCRELADMREFVERFLGRELPAAGECFSQSYQALKRVNALLDFCIKADVFTQTCGPPWRRLRDL